jgi:hypothetical protein
MYSCQLDCGNGVINAPAVNMIRQSRGCGSGFKGVGKWIPAKLLLDCTLKQALDGENIGEACGNCDYESELFNFCYMAGNLH